MILSMAMEFIDDVEINAMSSQWTINGIIYLGRFWRCEINDNVCVYEGPTKQHEYATCQNRVNTEVKLFVKCLHRTSRPDHNCGM